MGFAFALSEGARFAIENGADSTFIIRVHMFMAD